MSSFLLPLEGGATVESGQLGHHGPAFPEAKSQDRGASEQVQKLPYTPKDEKSPALSVFDASPHFPAPEAHLLACPATQH